MSRYEHIFFDLDRTLWDFDSNSREALLEMIASHGLRERGVEDADAFISNYQKINEHYWALYRRQEISKELLRTIRFADTLRLFAVEDEKLAASLADDYIAISPRKTQLLPGAIELLDHLAAHYRLHIITNGFEEVQHIKLRHSGLQPYFKEVITSERAGAKKPGPAIFQLACSLSGARIETSLMVGDDLETDIRGARGVGMDQAYLNVHKHEHGEEVTHEVHMLHELRGVL